MMFCTFEDRPAEFTRVALLANSLFAHEPSAELAVYARSAPEWFYEFATRHSGLRVVDSSGIQASGWCVKPEVLLHLLSEGLDRIVWIDSDIVLAGPICSRLAVESADTIVVAEEVKWRRIGDGPTLAAAWGLKGTRRLKGNVNSCVVSVSRTHRALLKRWRDLMLLPAFVAAQAEHFPERPTHLAGDQEVLDALLCSEESGGIPVLMLRSGRDLAQCHEADGYSVVDRLLHVWGRLPPLVHAQGFKPWLGKPWLTPKAGEPEYATRADYLDVSPYNYVASRYCDGIPDRCEWLHYRRSASRILNTVCCGEPNLAGLPFAVWTAAKRLLR